jgi:hypothetical protein
MMRGGRIAVVAVVGCAAVGVVGAGVVQAAGEKVTSTIKVSPVKPKVGKSGKPVNINFKFDVKIAKPDGSREAALKTVDITFPKGIVMNAANFKNCNVASLKANKPQDCAPSTEIGHRSGIVNGQPLFKQPLTSDFAIYKTSAGKTSFTWASYGTVKEIPTLHAVETGNAKIKDGRVVVHLDVPRLPTAPGLPDGTIVGQGWSFDGKTSKGSFLQATQPCKTGWKVVQKYVFVDGSSQTVTPKVSC